MIGLTIVLFLICAIFAIICVFDEEFGVGMCLALIALYLFNMGNTVHTTNLELEQAQALNSHYSITLKAKGADLADAKKQIMNLTAELQAAEARNNQLPLCIKEVELGNATFDEIQAILEK